MKSARTALLVFGYALFLFAVLPAFATYKVPTWGLVPLWLAVAGHTLNLMRYATPDDEEAKRFEVASLMVWLAFYMISIVWPLHMHWFDALFVLSLFLDRKSPLGLGLVTSYYVFSLVYYMGAREPLQVSARGILAGTLVQDVFKAYKA